MSAFKLTRIIYKDNIYIIPPQTESLEKQIVYMTNPDININVTIDNIKQQTKKEMREAKIKSKNNDSLRIYFMIHMLHLIGYKFNIEKIYKKGIVTFPLARITEIIKDSEIIYTEPNEELDKIGRARINAQLNNTLLSLLSTSYKVICKFKKTRPTLNGFPMIRFTKIILNSTQYSINDINDIGQETFHKLVPNITKSSYIY